MGIIHVRHEIVRGRLDARVAGGILGRGLVFAVGIMDEGRNLERSSA
jgi:hypothetical protein